MSQPNDCGGKVSGLVVSSGDGAKLLEFGEEVLHQAVDLVEVAVVMPSVSSIALDGMAAVLPAAANGTMPVLICVKGVSPLRACACIAGRRWPAPIRSWASSPVRTTSNGLPTWILVLSPPPERPIAWCLPALLGARTVPMSAHNGAVDYGVFIAGIRGQMLDDPLPEAGFGPTTKPCAQPSGRRNAPRSSHGILARYRLNEQSVAARGHSGMTGRRSSWPLGC